MQDYKLRIITKKEITTNKAIANFFGLGNHSSVTDYLKDRLPLEVYEERYRLCSEAGREKGGE